MLLIDWNGLIWPQLILSKSCQHFILKFLTHNLSTVVWLSGGSCLLGNNLLGQLKVKED